MNEVDASLLFAARTLLPGVYGWEGLNPIPPEAWLLPYKYNPVHPGRFWCHCRMVYLPMSYLYGKRATGAATPLTEAGKGRVWVLTSIDALIHGLILEHSRG